MNKPKMDTAVLGRVLRELFCAYPVLAPLTAVCIVFSAVVSAIPAIFTQKVLAVVTGCLESGTLSWVVAREQILPRVGVLMVMVFSFGLSR